MYMGSQNPLKIPIFLWQLFENVVLTREAMWNKKWHGDPICSFCDQIESRQHFFFFFLPLLELFGE